jgi:hypothetical protein
MRERIWAELPERRARLGIGLYRLDWSARKIHSFVDSTLRAGAGGWVFGIYGAVAEFCIGPDEPVEVTIGVEWIEAATARSGLRIAFSEHLRVLALGADATADVGTIILAVPRARATLVANSGLRAFGPDQAAIRLADRGHEFYDFGLGSLVSQFCIRTADSDLRASLNKRVGQTWPNLLAEVGGQILQTSPSRVVTSPLGRIEMFTPIPPPDGSSPLGPHTHTSCPSSWPPDARCRPAWKYRMRMRRAGSSIRASRQRGTTGWALRRNLLRIVRHRRGHKQCKRICCGA